jgi:hypothetical protein
MSLGAVVTCFGAMVICFGAAVTGSGGVVIGVMGGVLVHVLTLSVGSSGDIGAVP